MKKKSMMPQNFGMILSILVNDFTADRYRKASNAIIDEIETKKGIKPKSPNPLFLPGAEGGI